jgi:hypothetical protein
VSKLLHDRSGDEIPLSVAFDKNVDIPKYVDEQSRIKQEEMKKRKIWNF